ncbi:MAG: hypothetical protein LBI10_10440 [Deltaproteobacteria bacterium]|nr:hypothetical protein [Deltaproteobacteria bacterium]
MLADKALRDLFIEKRVVASLQFDGFKEETYVTLRGRPLLATKMALISLFEKEDLPYSLTAVMVRGVNEAEIPALADFFFEAKAVSLMIQPAAIVGRAGLNFTPQERLTNDEVVTSLETSKYIAAGDVLPLACSHPSCAASAYYFKIAADRFLSLKEFLGFEEYLKVTANRSFPGLDQEGQLAIKDKIYDLWSKMSPSSEDRAILEKVRLWLKRLEGREFTPREGFDLGRETVKSVFVHGFMDPYCLDLNRLVKCCYHYLQANGRLVPMCAHNLNLSKSQ